MMLKPSSKKFNEGNLSTRLSINYGSWRPNENLINYNFVSETFNQKWLNL